MFTKPILKWVGGKTQILPLLIDTMPREMNNYREPFVGGGSVLLAVLDLLSRKEIVIKGRVYAYDSNPNLILLYQWIQKDAEKLYEKVESYACQYRDCPQLNGDRTLVDEKKAAACSKESYYYWMRKEYNSPHTDELSRAALFIMLNKTGFRGMYREGPNGFNIPFGNYKNPTIASLDHLKCVSKLIKFVEFECRDFKDSIPQSTKGDIVYLDPPYVPLNATSFVGYTKGGFSRHEELFTLMNELSSDIGFILSNSNTPLVTDFFKDDKRYTICHVECKRRIHSKKPNSKADEVVISTKK